MIFWHCPVVYLKICVEKYSIVCIFKNLLGKILKPFFFSLLKPINRLNRTLNRFCIVQILLLDEFKIGMSMPKEIGKSFIQWRLCLCIPNFFIYHSALCFDKVGKRLTPIGNLMLDQFARILGCRLPIGCCRLDRQIVARATQGRICCLFGL